MVPALVRVGHCLLIIFIGWSAGARQHYYIVSVFRWDFIALGEGFLEFPLSLLVDGM